VQKILEPFFSHEFIRFVLTGVLNTVFGFLVYVLLYWLFGNKLIALFIDYALGILFNFKTYSLLVFYSNDNSRIYRFIFVYLFAFGLNYVSLYIFCDIYTINAYVGQMIALTYVPIVLYLLLKNAVFS
jgi:putative flippase GtrA